MDCVLVCVGTCLWMAVCIISMNFELYQDEDGQWICELVDLTEEECDVSRDQSVGFEALDAGAIGFGSSYRPSEDEFSAHVRAREKEVAQKAGEAYWEAIQTALDD